ncbi:hypothetical protein Afil01_55070 [Actinorhabdospora filicis]|uniref:Uncharacterized protein n=1 Tax=Actinorhabdospora filicis TaxID=1785913 RepID=A0A9W6SRM4_9ACTN|nr:hypothetical protein Afil01_55070 [Actinorhabdospora filicis]
MALARTGVKCLVPPSSREAACPHSPVEAGAGGQVVTASGQPAGAMADRCPGRSPVTRNRAAHLAEARMSGPGVPGGHG